MIAYALLFRSQFREALPFLRRAWEQSNPNTEEGLPVLLAWAMIECGQWDGITSLVGPTPLPQAAGPGPFISLYFPRLFYLRGRNFERLGKKDRALENYRLFLKLSGSDAEMWGDEQRAREKAESTPRGEQLRAAARARESGGSSDEWDAALSQALGRHVDPEAAALPPFALGDANELRRLLADAGFAGVEVAPAEVTLRFPSAAEFVRLVAAGAPPPR